VATLKVAPGQLVENVDRKDLLDVEKARLLKAMKDKFGCTQE